MDAKVTNFRNLMAENIVGERDRLVTPVFQRQYVWGKDQWEDLWSDLKRLTDSALDPESEQEDDGHIMGMVVIQEPEGKGRSQKLQLIDGQQRITTLSVLLAAMRQHLKGKPDSVRVISEIEGYLFRRPLVGEKEQTDRVKLCLGLKDRDVFNAFVLTDTPVKFKAKTGNIAKCAKFWMDELAGLPEDWLHALYDTVAKRLQFVCMKLDSHEAESFVFATVNGSGVQLTVSELIKNALLKDVEELEASSIHDLYWLPFEELVPTSGGQKRFFEIMVTLYKGLSHAKNVYREVRILKEEQGDEFYKLFTRLYRFYGKDQLTVESTPARLGLRWHLLANDNKVNLMLACSILCAHAERRLSEAQTIRAMDLALYLVTKSRMLDEDNHLATDIGKEIKNWHCESGELYLYRFEKFVRAWKSMGLEPKSVFESPFIDEMSVKAQAELCLVFYVLEKEEKALSEKAAKYISIEPSNAKKKNAGLSDYNIKWGESPIYTNSLSHLRRDDIFAFGSAYFEDVLRMKEPAPAGAEIAESSEEPSAVAFNSGIATGDKITFAFKYQGETRHRTFTLVNGPVSATSDNISIQSGVGQNFLGRKAGDVFFTPLRDGWGSIEVQIISVE